MSRRYGGPRGWDRGVANREQLLRRVTVVGEGAPGVAAKLLVRRSSDVCEYGASPRTSVSDEEHGSYRLVLESSSYAVRPERVLLCRHVTLCCGLTCPRDNRSITSGTSYATLHKSTSRHASPSLGQPTSKQISSPALEFHQRS